MRLLGLPSAVEGRDWDKLVRRIDQQVEQQSFDLAEETILIEFKKGEVTVFRSVIGGLKVLSSPFVLEDRVSTQVDMRTITSEFWDEILDEVGGRDCTLFLKRRIAGELKLSVEAFFSFF
jgi:hypothetical protein